MQLLRRQLARRCIYGVDRNPMAVELARLSLWTHTFVPGLPLSLLDAHLVQGDSLVGIGTMDEAQEVLSEVAGGALLAWKGRVIFAQAAEGMRRVASLADADSAEVRQARQELQKARQVEAPLKAMFDILTASRLGDGPEVGADLFTRWENDPASIPSSSEHRQALDTLRLVSPFHFPIAFPDVFQREPSGFDVILGNPPWDKVRYEPQQFWVSRSPGLNALPANQRPSRIDELRTERPAEATAEQREFARRQRLQQYFQRSYHRQGRGHLDFAKLFLERLTHLSALGRLGQVLPRQFLVLGGWSQLRNAVLRDHDVTVIQARNRGGWIFEDVHHSYMIVLLGRAPVQGDPSTPIVFLWPAVTNSDELSSLIQDNAFQVTSEELGEYSDTLAIPWFESIVEVNVFDKMRSHPKLGSGQGWIQGRSDSGRWDFSGSGRHRNLASTRATPGSWRVLMTRHVAPYEIKRSVAYQRFVTRPEDLVVEQRGVVAEDAQVYLSASHPLIVYRYPSRSEDARTLIAAALGATGELFSTGYVHGVSHPSDTSIEAKFALLGYFNSFICDWWVRRFADRHVTAPIINNIPLPSWGQETITTVSSLAQELTKRRGTTHIVGNIRVQSQHSESSDDELLSQIEKEVAKGFGLESSDVDTILSDFTVNGCPTRLRSCILHSLK